MLSEYWLHPVLSHWVTLSEYWVSVSSQEHDRLSMLIYAEMRGMYDCQRWPLIIVYRYPHKFEKKNIEN